MKNLENTIMTFLSCCPFYFWALRCCKCDISECIIVVGLKVYQRVNHLVKIKNIYDFSSPSPRVIGELICRNPESVCHPS